MMKHAYLIIAHANPFVLEKLIQLLDDERNDIYIHIDKKSTAIDIGYISRLPQQSKIYFTERMSTNWGDISLVKTEFLLFEKAFANGGYSYYHLISGGDLPTKSQNYIHHFFEKYNGYEFIGFSNDVWDAQRVNKIHLFSRYMRAEANEPLKRLARKIRLLFITFQDKIGYNYGSAMQGKFAFGSQWVSVTNAFVSDLLQEKGKILRFYRYANCSDEIYKQTFAINSHYKDKIFDSHDELHGCMRLMDWKRGRPYTFRVEDYQEIMTSDKLFARKFDDRVDKQIVEMIFSAIMKQQNEEKE